MRVLALCFMVASCATPAAFPGQEGRLVAGAEVAAPQGLIDYCTRDPQQCGRESPPEGLRGREEATGASSYFTDISAQRTAANTIFQTLMASRIAARNSSAEDVRHAVSLTEVLWQQLRAVNRDINERIVPTTDRTLYGVDDYWTRPLVTDPRVGRGDCEDYALEKRARLLNNGWPADSLALAVAMAPGVGLHAVLVVETDHGDFVLDNLQAEPRAASSLNYVWLSRQAGADMTHWTSVRVADEAAHMQSIDLSPEDMFHRLMEERAARSPNYFQTASPDDPSTAPASEPRPLLPDEFAPEAPHLFTRPLVELQDYGIFTRTGFVDAVILRPAGLRLRTGETAE